VGHLSFKWLSLDFIGMAGLLAAGSLFIGGLANAQSNFNQPANILSL
jgi:hypothetical protein